MAEDEAIFDPTLKKKKKKKKSTFDIDAALAEGNTEVEAVDVANNAGETETKEEEPDDANVDADLDFTKKKRKRRSPSRWTNRIWPCQKTRKEESKVNLKKMAQLDFTKTKKKKKKKKDLDELMAEAEEKAEDKENVDENSTLWVGSDRDYTYEELLNRAFEIMRDKNPDMAAGKKQKFVMRPPQVVKIGAKKTSFANFTEICKMLHQSTETFVGLFAGRIGYQWVGRRKQSAHHQGYIKEYVTCHTCRSPDTILQKDTRLFFLQCETCGSRCSVASIKSGFQAVTSKRAAIRAKTA
ncbi:hypothetical protein NQ318_010829 [Aromia moschata]|uniref:Eukaryotic translation initiation factor 2 subunit 2 n=1 Tax=Aromia moschata TaxID=1265417 RepID=A0AAV8YGP9_9CUCU|nr:hypothetical protein NQ318_010829 [Aromia moschata]